MAGISKFFGFQTPLSNLRFTPFTFQDQKFHSMEQCYQFQKAEHFQDKEAMKAVVEAKTPVEAKRAAKQLTKEEEDKWLGIAFDIMYQGCLAKFSQNKGPRKYLFKTAGNTLAECNPRDSIWGIGLSKFDHRADDPTTWEGKNWMGKVLMAVRDHLMNRPEYEEELKQIEAGKEKKRPATEEAQAGKKQKASKNSK